MRYWQVDVYADFFYRFIYHRFCKVSEVLCNADLYKELLSFLDEVG